MTSTAPVIEQLGLYARERQALLSLTESEGWKHVTSVTDTHYVELTGKLLSPTTPKDEAEVLRHVCREIKENYSIRAIVANRLKTLNAKIDSLTAKQNTQPS